MTRFSKQWTFMLAAAIIILVACGNKTQQTPQVEGHYTYEHAFNYDLMKKENG